MADLQRTINVQPTISSYGTPQQGPNVAAQAVAVLGDQAKSFVMEKKKSKLDTELNTLGDEVFAASTGKEIKNTTERFKTLQRAKEQGVLSDTMVKLETEKILKESIDSMPAFAPELRTYAAQILGYDPTGSQVRALLNVPDPNKDTFANQQRERAEYIATQLGVDVQDVMKVQAKNLFAKEKSDLVTRNATIGAAGRREIFNATLDEADGFISDFMMDIISQVQQGGVKNEEVVLSRLEAAKLGHKQALQDRYRSAGINPDSSELSQDMSGVDARWKSLYDLVESGSFSKILANNSKDIANAMTIESWNVFGDTALINEALGQEGVKHYFTTLNKMNDKGQIQLLMENNPAFKRTVKSLDDAKVLAAQVYKEIMGVEPIFDNTSLFTGGLASTEEKNVKSNLRDRMFYETLKDNLPEETRTNLLAYAKSHGQKYKVLGGYFQKGVRPNASPEEVRYVTQTFEEEYPALVSRIVAELSTSNKNMQLVNRNGSLVLVDKAGANYGGLLGSHVFGTEDYQVSDTLQYDLARLNSFNAGVQNGWATDLKQNPNSFINDTLAEVNRVKSQVVANQEKLDSVLQTFYENPTKENLEALRVVDPDLVAELERRTTSQISTDGGNNAKQ